LDEKELVAFEVEISKVLYDKEHSVEDQNSLFQRSEREDDFYQFDCFLHDEISDEIYLLYSFLIEKAFDEDKKELVKRIEVDTFNLVIQPF
jgi:hypothetical protein